MIVRRDAVENYQSLGKVNIIPCKCTPLSLGQQVEDWPHSKHI